MLKRFFLIFLATAFVFILAGKVSAANNVQLDFFYSPICPHCHDEIKFLTGIAEKYPQFKINQYDLTVQANVALLMDFYSRYGVPQESQGYVPANFIGDRAMIGFNDVIAAEIENQIKIALGLGAGGHTATTSADRIILPIFGALAYAKSSPLILAITLGTLDGFNACALTALGILLAFLISTNSRRRVFLVGGTFILVSAVVYFLFISAWFSLFTALANTRMITIVIGVVVLALAFFMFKEYINDIVCKLCHLDEKENFLSRWQKKLFTIIANITMRQMSLPVLLFSVAIVSAGINTLELVCSFGLPLAFTKILAGRQLSVLNYYSYLAIYIIFYCLLEFIIFAAAVVTMRVTKFKDKYVQAVKLISGIILLILALLILFRPETLALK